MKGNFHYNIILASGSSGRKKLLEKLGVPFTVIVPDVDEERITDPDPIRTIQLRSIAKMNAAIQLFSRRYTLNAKRSIIIAADSMVVLGKTAYGKPRDQDDARRILGKLQGRTFRFVTHVVIIRVQGQGYRVQGKSEERKVKTEQNMNHYFGEVTSKENSINNSLSLQERARVRSSNHWEKTVTTMVTFRKMTQKDLDRYLLTYDVTRFAGGFALDEAPWNLVTKIDGSYTNVIGLPFEAILPTLMEIKNIS